MSNTMKKQSTSAPSTCPPEVFAWVTQLHLVSGVNNVQLKGQAKNTSFVPTTSYKWSILKKTHTIVGIVGAIKHPALKQDSGVPIISGIKFYFCFVIYFVFHLQFCWVQAVSSGLKYTHLQNYTTLFCLLPGRRVWAHVERDNSRTPFTHIYSQILKGQLEMYL